MFCASERIWSRGAGAVPYGGCKTPTIVPQCVILAGVHVGVGGRQKTTTYGIENRAHGFGDGVEAPYRSEETTRLGFPFEPD